MEKNITTQNYKAEMLLNALRKLSNQKGLGYTNLLMLSRLSTKLEDVMKPYLELRRDIISKFSKKDEKTGQNVIDPDKQEEAMKAMEELAQAEVSLDFGKVSLKVKDDSFLDLEIIKSFTDVLGEDNFTLEVEQAKPIIPNM